MNTFRQMLNKFIKRLMFFLLIAYISNNMFSQSCEFDGKTNYIAYNKIKKTFIDTSSSLGEFGLYFDILNCVSNKLKTKISAKILYSPLEAKGKSKPFCNVFLAKRNKTEFRVVDTLGSFKIYENFDLSFVRKKDTYLIFYNDKIKSFAIKTSDFKYFRSTLFIKK